MLIANLYWFPFPDNTWPIVEAADELTVLILSLGIEGMSLGGEAGTVQGR